MKKKPTLVVALGGNALLKRGEPLEADIQQANIKLAAKVIAQLTKQWKVVLVHGNGPQIGLLALQNSVYEPVKPYPLDILGAESQGMIGYMLQQALMNELPKKKITVLLTQVEVDPNDPAMDNPQKFIGPVYDKQQGELLSSQKGWSVKADGQYFRRVVPSPEPKFILEEDAINTLIESDHLVICNGGGGVPVLKGADGYHGIEAVIDKDLAAALLACQIKADALLILTDADAIYRNWGKTNQQAISQISPLELSKISFDAGSMGPKVDGCCRFVTRCHGVAGIGSLENGLEILDGTKGTLIIE